MFKGIACISGIYLKNESYVHNVSFTLRCYGKVGGVGKWGLCSKGLHASAKYI